MMVPESVRKAIRADAPPKAEASMVAWLDWLENVEGDEIKLGLGKCLDVGTKLGLVNLSPQVITVAGTNGKGSCCHYLEAIILELGYKVGTYTSPHITHFNERIRVNGHNVSSTEICNAFYTLSKISGSAALTYFEFITIASLNIFNAYNLDFVILEVGLGGRLDAVNIVESDVALITSIGLDHVEWLGETREEIALEKAGIMRPGKPVVCSDKEVPRAIYSHAELIEAELSILGVDYFMETEDSYWEWSSNAKSLTKLPYPVTSGAHQLRNISGVLKVLELLNIDAQVLESSVRKVCHSLVIPGRMQSISHDLGFEIFVDVAHNEPAAEILSREIMGMRKVQKTACIFGMLSTKDVVGFLTHLTPVIDRLYLVELDNAGALSAEEVMETAKSLDKKLKTSCHSSCDQILSEIFENKYFVDRLIITGSFITVGEAMKFIQEKIA